MNASFYNWFFSNSLHNLHLISIKSTKKDKNNNRTTIMTKLCKSSPVHHLLEFNFTAKKETVNHFVNFPNNLCVPNHIKLNL